jgi:hypothetical protein
MWRMIYDNQREEIQVNTNIENRYLKKKKKPKILESVVTKDTTLSQLGLSNVTWYENV